MNILKALVCSAALVMPALAMAVHPRQYPDTFLIPERAIILTGNRASAGRLVAVLYNQEDMHFNEPNCPRFLFLDREGKIALGIGGYAKVSFQYDMRGSIDQGANFIPYDIPVPNRDDQTSAFYANANHSSIFLQLVGRNDKIGTYQMYILGDFTGNGFKGYGFRLKQAYLAYVSREYIVYGRNLEKCVFEIIANECEEKEDLPDVCKIALLKYYSDKEYSEEMAAVLHQVIREMCEKQLVFPYYLKYPEEWLREVQLYNKVMAAYRCKPGGKVRLYYKICLLYTSDAADE